MIFARPTAPLPLKFDADERKCSVIQKGYRMQRFGRVLRLRGNAEAEYESLHAVVWAEVLEAITLAGICNYSIYRYHQWLFSYYELPDHRTGSRRRRVI